MSELTSLLDEIVAAGKRRGVKSQKALAARAGIGEVTLSRAKSADDILFSTLQRLAKSVGLRLALLPDEAVAAKIEKGELFR